MRKIRLTALFPLFILIFAVEAVAGVMPEDPALSALIQQALRENPAIAAAQGKAQALEARIAPAGTWMDPMAEIMLMNLPVDSWDMRREAMSALQFSVIQTIPLTKMPRTSREIAELQAQNGRFGQQNVQQSVARRIALEWYQWAYLLEAVKITKASIASMEQMLQTGYAMYAAGMNEQSEVLRMEVEKAQMEDMKLMLEQMADASGSNIAALLGDLPENVPNPPETLPADFAPLNEAELDTLILQIGIDFRAMELELAMADKMKLKARQMWIPELTVSAGYGYRPEDPEGMGGTDIVTFTVGAPIPIFGKSKQGKMVEEAMADYRGMQAGLEDMRLQMLFKVKVMTGEDARLGKQIDLFDRTIIPQAQAAFRTALASYSAGKGSVEAPLSTLNAALEVQRERLSRIAERAKLRAELAEMCGVILKSANSE